MVLKSFSRIIVNPDNGKKGDTNKSKYIFFHHKSLGNMKDEPGSCSFSLVQYSKPKVISLEIGTSQGTYNIRWMN